MEENNKGRTFGYARVSTKEQNLDRQLVALKQYVPEENIVVDKQSGKDLNRAGYQALKGVLGLRSGDTLIIKDLDRLSRNKSDILKELQYFSEKGIKVKIIDLPTTMHEFPEEQRWIGEMVNKIIVEVLSSIAEQERLNIRRRQREGIDVAKAKGKHLGRPKLIMPAEFPEIYRMWMDKRITAREAQRRLGMSNTSFYRMVKIYQKVTQ